jgi:hypothetical protein
MLQRVPDVQLPPPSFDAASAYPEIAAARAALSARDWAAFEAVFQQCDQAGRTLIAQHIHHDAYIEGFLQQVVDERPANPVAWLALGSVFMRSAWQFRTGARHQHVRSDQFEQFFSYLRRAEECLTQATTLGPAIAAAWVLRIRAARGLQLSIDETWHRYQQLLTIDPHPYAGQQQVLQTLCPKWSGSFEQVDAFAEHCMRSAPIGAPNAALVAEAQVERLIEFDSEARIAYFRQRHVRAALWQAARRSIFSPQWTPVRGWVMAMNMFAMAFYQTGFLPEARRCFLAIGPYAAGGYWSYRGGDDESAFMSGRDAAFADRTPVDPRREEVLDQYLIGPKPSLFG